MPRIIPSTTLRNQYNEISKEAHADPEPIYVTKNGTGDLAVLSVEAYERLARRASLVDELARGHADTLAGRVQDANAVLSSLRKEFS